MKKVDESMNEECHKRVRRASSLAELTATWKHKPGIRKSEDLVKSRRHI